MSYNVALFLAPSRLEEDEAPVIKFNLHAVYGLARAHFPGEDQFTLSLPVEITEGVTLENVSALISPDSFDGVRKRIGTDATDRLEGVHHALVHRYEPMFMLDENKKELITHEMQDHASEQRVSIIRALLRLIRPTREELQNMHGNVRHDGSLDVMGFEHPARIFEVPQNQKLFSIRNEDVEALIALSPTFLKAMREDYWEIRMAVQFHDQGHHQVYYPKARYLLWMAAIEGLYTSVDEQGSKLAKARIRWFLGDKTSIYPKGELHDLNREPHITVGDILDDLYLMRNCISHGDRLDDRYFAIARDDLAEGLPLFGVLTEGASFIIRHSLLKILRAGLIEHFKGPAESSAYFAANGYSKRDVDSRVAESKNESGSR